MHRTELQRGKRCHLPGRNIFTFRLRTRHVRIQIVTNNEAALIFVTVNKLIFNGTKIHPRHSVRSIQERYIEPTNERSRRSTGNLGLR